MSVPSCPKRLNRCFCFACPLLYSGCCCEQQMRVLCSSLFTTNACIVFVTCWGGCSDRGVCPVQCCHRELSYASSSSVFPESSARCMGFKQSTQDQYHHVLLICVHVSSIFTFTPVSCYLHQPCSSVSYSVLYRVSLYETSWSLSYCLQ